MREAVAGACLVREGVTSKFEAKVRRSSRYNERAPGFPGPFSIRARTSNLPLLEPHDRAAAVQAARLLAIVVVLRTFLAVADDLEAAGVDAAARQYPDGLRATLTECHVARSCRCCTWPSIVSRSVESACIAVIAVQNLECVRSRV